jgi:murein DD-endopeptidase MepM/ murein hydrolase activator NlpD
METGSDMTSAASARATARVVVSILCAVARIGAQDVPSAVGIALTARAFQPGELIVVELSPAQEPASLTLTAFGRRVPVFRVSDHRWRALLGVDLEQAPGSYELAADAVLASGRVRETRPLLVEPKAFLTRTLSVNPDFVNPPPSTDARIEAEALFLRGVYSRSAGRRLWEGAFVRPVDDPANSAFGTRSVFNGEARNPHAGTDFLSKSGTPVRAPNAGRVVAARDLYFTGNTVIVDHGLGLFSVLAHLSRIQVEEGETVASGRIVGEVGSTGRVTGAHLHWSLRVGEARVDPLSALEIIKE